MMPHRERHQASSKMWVPLLLMSIALFNASPQEVNLCEFCSCTPTELDCSDVFWKGERLKHALPNWDFPQVHLKIPPSKITQEIFRGFENISVIDLSLNGLSSFDESLFLNFRSLKQISLSNNHFEDFPVLSGLQSLDILSLDGNVLRETPRHLNWTTPGVRILQLQENQIRTVSGAHLPLNLSMLDLSENLISILDISSFKGLLYLESVDLRNNRITKVNDQAFSVPMLHRVMLRGNDIGHMSTNAFSKSLSDLTLTGNNLLELADLEGLETINSLFIEKKGNCFSNSALIFPLCSLP